MSFEVADDDDDEVVDLDLARLTVYSCRRTGRGRSSLSIVDDLKDLVRVEWGKARRNFTKPKFL
jgi:hypothetical protein